MEEPDQTFDICRVCRGEATGEHPLFYPCLCSGSIKYVHQECLLEWLKHSKKKYCELCNHPFQFTPVYKERMPARLPLFVILKSLIVILVRTLLYSLRLSIVSTVWLIMLPLALSSVVSLHFGYFRTPFSLQLVQLAFQVSVGIGSLAISAIIVISLIVMKEYLESYRMLRIRRRRPAPAPTPVNHPEPIPENIEALSDTTSIANRPSISRSAWLEGIDSKEYRLYLRRRELVKMRSENRNVFRPSSTSPSSNQQVFSDNESNFIDSDVASTSTAFHYTDTRSVIATSLNQAPLSDTTIMDTVDEEAFGDAIALRRRSRPVRMIPSTSRGDTAVNPPHLASGINISRDNIRCKICLSVTCISREHVIEASKRRRDEPTVPAQPPPVQLPRQVDAQIEPLLEDENDNDAPINQAAADNEAAFARLSLTDLLGLTGNILGAFQNAFVLFCLSLITLHVFIFLPNMYGKYIVQIIPLEKLLVIWNGLQHVPFIDSELLISSFSQIYKGLSFGGSAVELYIRNTFVGTFVICLLMNLHVYLATANSSPSRTHRKLLKLFLTYTYYWKAIAVLSIELILFPYVCGIVSVLCFRPIFTDFSNLWTFITTHPHLTHYLVWIIGTIVLISVSSIIGKTREFVRPGLLYFIRNPSDFENPVLKEILERPIYVELKQLLFSFLMFCILFGSNFVAFVTTLKILVPKLIPLNISSANILSLYPFQLLAAIGWNYLRRNVLSVILDQIYRSWFEKTVKVIKLSSYIYGGRYPREERLLAGRYVYVPDADKVYERSKVIEMFNRPVEAVDIARIPVKEARPTISLFSLPPEPRRPPRFNIQGRRSDEVPKGFTVVYRPSFIWLRFLALLVSLSGLFITLGLILFAAPLLVGRLLLGKVFSDEPSDHHCLEVGMFVFLIAAKLAQYIVRSLEEHTFAELFTSFLSIPRMILQCIVVLFSCYVALPLLLGVWFMLVFLPLFPSNETPIIPITLSWIIGIAYCHILFILRHLILSAERNRVINELTSLDGWIHMKFGQIFGGIVLPYMWRFFALIIGPPSIVLFLGPLINLTSSQIYILQRWSYVLSLAVPFVGIVGWISFKLVHRLTDRIRDENYLLGRQLHNLDRTTNT